MIAILAIARATILELRRQRLMIVPIIGILLSIVVLGAVLLLNDGSFDLQERDAELAALGTGIGAAVGGTIYAVIVGSGLIAREIVAGTMLMLAARPIGRWQIIAGRVLGSSVFLLAILLFVCLSYALVSMVTAGSLAPFDEPFVAFAYGAPAVMLGLTFGIACSVQGKATAATGTAIGIVLFAWAVGIYAEEWREEQHKRSFLTEEVRDELDSNDAFIGPVALTLTRALPFWVFTKAAQDAIEEHERYQYDDEYQRLLDAPIDTTTNQQPDFGFAVPAGPVEPIAVAPDGSTGEWEVDPNARPIPQIDPAAPAAPGTRGKTAPSPMPDDSGAPASTAAAKGETDPNAGGSAVDPATGQPTPGGPVIDPATGLPSPTPGVAIDPTTGEAYGTFQQQKLPDDPDERAFECAEYGGAGCFLGYKNAWKVKQFERVGPMHEGLGLLLAWLSIPLWMGIAMLLLHRRRDLT